MSSEQSLAAILEQGVDGLSLTLSESQLSLLVRYIELLYQWNQSYNLTAVRDATQMMKRHVIDSLSVVSILSETLSGRSHLADIGTGGGVPGVVLAIVMPELQVSLVESINKKCRFLTQAKLELELNDQIEIVNQRVELWQASSKVDAVICRAFTEPERFVRLTKHLSPDFFFAMTASLTDNQLQPLKELGLEANCYTLTVPFSGAARYLYVFSSYSSLGRMRGVR